MHTINIYGVPMPGTEVDARGTSGMKKMYRLPFLSRSL